MKHVVRTALAAGALVSIGTALLAQAEMDPETMTCADFVALTPDEQSAALEEIELASMQAEAEASAEAAPEGDGAEPPTEPPAEPDSAASSDAGSEAAGEASAAEDEAEAEADSEAMMDPQIQALISACEGNEEALVLDQYSSM